MKKIKNATFDSIIVFTDGACSGNPGRGGWGAVVVVPEGQVRELGGGEIETTNNRMELTAALRALNFIANDDRKVQLYTDSTYLIRGITQWIWGWRRKGWLNAEGQDVLNRDLWEKLFLMVTSRGTGKIEWHYSRGHVGIPGNERCDEIAVAFTKGRWIELYDGSLLKYPVPILDLPENTALPEMKPAKEKKPAYSYLSYLNGEVWRHRDWVSCEKRVKGRSGAKFKKALSDTDEVEILKTWGLPPRTVIKE